MGAMAPNGPSSQVPRRLDGRLPALSHADIKGEGPQPRCRRWHCFWRWTLAEDDRERLSAYRDSRRDCSDVR